MSRWVHVAAVFRIDCLGDQGFEDVFGKSIVWPRASDANYDSKVEEYERRMDDYEKHPEDYLPCGSEGSLVYEVLVSRKYADPHYEVVVIGDLRDFYDDRTIVEWFQSSCDKIDWLRQAVLHVKPTHGEEIMITRRN